MSQPTDERDPLTLHDETSQRFSLDDVRVLLPETEVIVSRFLQLHAQVRQLLSDLHGTDFSPLQADFDVDPTDAPAPIQDALSSLKLMMACIQEDMFNLVSMGCRVDDVEEGVLYWLGSADQEDILFCWQVGDSSVGHWCYPDEDFRTRRSLEALQAAASTTTQETALA